jgi:hypothetical protein
LKLYDDEGNPSILVDNIDAYANLLNIITSNKKDDEIGEEILSLVGYHNWDVV